MKGLLRFLSIAIIVIQATLSPILEVMADAYDHHAPGLHTHDQSFDHYRINSVMYRGLKDSTVSVTIVENVMLFPLFNAVTMYQGYGNYVILINIGLTAEESDWTLLHEWGHVYQMQDSLLVKDADEKWYWKGELVDWNLPWIKRPWEQAAEDFAELHFKKMYPMREPRKRLSIDIK